MADEITPSTTTKSADHDKPLGYWVIKGLAILGICVLAGLSLFSDQDVSPIVFGLLATIAAGPEAAQWLRK